MAAASIGFDLKEVDAVKKIFANAALSDSDRGRLLRSISLEIEEQTKERFELGESPDGNSWKALAQKTMNYYESKGLASVRSILVGEGFLRASITSEVQGGAWSVLVGATMEYAAVHQFGWDKKNIPARPYLGVSADDMKAVENAVAVFLGGLLHE